MATFILMIAIAYVAGSIPTGYWVAKAVKGIDIREHGSKSTGATNVLRCVGKGPALFVFLFDIFKGYAPVAAAAYCEGGRPDWALFGITHVCAPLCALAALIGHSKSIFLGLQGGKSAATGLGTVIALSNPVGALLFATWLLVLWATKIVSVASIAAVWLLPVYFYLLKCPPAQVAYGVMALIYVTLRHKANIKRLLDGTEPKVGQKAKAAAAAFDGQKKTATTESQSSEESSKESNEPEDSKRSRESLQS
ncbi:MAG: glycerol-3-phosphate 1-O-acyltransferase PlsY [Candidatus Melainabacteria bacterium]|nr:glycerol-3-phosphate 1-O-acyltransferase PlsY [Candidatus Melainabacteria bacterium]